MMSCESVWLYGCMNVCSSNPDITTVCRDAESSEVIGENRMVYKGEPQDFSCNPSWTSSASFDAAPFAGQSQVTGACTFVLFQFT